MDDSSPSPLPPDAHATRRDRRADRSRRRWKRIASVVAVTAMLVGFGLVITETVRLGGGDRPSLAGVVSATPSSRAPGASTTTTIPGRPCRSPLTDADPLRLWIGGDSLAGSLGPALGTVAGGTGVVQPQFDSRVSSGLTSPSFFDWPEHARKEMERLNPEVAVFIIGANDFNAPLNGAAVGEDGQPAWRAEYTALVDEMLAAFDTGGRTVVWIGSPVFKDEQRDVAIRQIDELMQEVVGKHRNVAYVDAYTLFADAEGKYASSLPPLTDPTGEPVPVRSGDGVHFTPQGGERLAQAVYGVLDAQCRTTAQAVPGVVKGTIQTEGSTQVVGGTSRSGTPQTSPPASGSQGGSQSVTPAPTTPPETAPPETAPPETTSAPATTAPTASSTP